jgi:hypothetical protein
MNCQMTTVPGSKCLVNSVCHNGKGSLRIGVAIPTTDSSTLPKQVWREAELAKAMTRFGPRRSRSANSSQGAVFS